MGVIEPHGVFEKYDVFLTIPSSYIVYVIEFEMNHSWFAIYPVYYFRILHNYMVDMQARNKLKVNYKEVVQCTQSATPISGSTSARMCVPIYTPIFETFR